MRLGWKTSALVLAGMLVVGGCRGDSSSSTTAPDTAAPSSEVTSAETQPEVTAAQDVGEPETTESLDADGETLEATTAAGSGVSPIGEQEVILRSGCELSAMDPETGDVRSVFDWPCLDVDNYEHFVTNEDRTIGLFYNIHGGSEILDLTTGNRFKNGAGGNLAYWPSSDGLTAVNASYNLSGFDASGKGTIFMTAWFAADDPDNYLFQVPATAFFVPEELPTDDRVDSTPCHRSSNWNETAEWCLAPGPFDVEVAPTDDSSESRTSDFSEEVAVHWWTGTTLILVHDGGHKISLSDVTDGPAGSELNWELYFDAPQRTFDFVGANDSSIFVLSWNRDTEMGEIYRIDADKEATLMTSFERGPSSALDLP